MSRITGSKRVNPASAATSRSRCTWITAATVPSASPPAGFQTRSGSRRAWKCGSTGMSSPNPSGRFEDRVQFHLLQGPLREDARRSLASRDSLQHRILPERSQPFCDLRLLLDESEAGGVVHDLQVVPQFGDDPV